VVFWNGQKYFDNFQVEFSNAYGANFRGSDMDGCLMYRAETKLARFDDAILSPTSDIQACTSPAAELGEASCHRFVSKVGCVEDRGSI